MASVATTTKADKERLKAVQERCQAILAQMLRDEDNKYCVDCDAKGPRWASWNLGLFLCIRCAGIHRNLGVHISKVKSVNLDTWTPEQVACLQQMGNSRARAVYEANLPDNFRRPQTDSSLEAFVRAKYEQKKYIAKEWKPPPMPIKPAFEIEDEKKKPREKKSKAAKSRGIELSIPPAAVNSARNSTSDSDVDRSSVTRSNGTVDLLGLGEPTVVATAVSPDDPFGNFLSAESGSVGLSQSANGRTPVDTDGSTKNGEGERGAGSMSLGEMTSDDGNRKKQLSKESILSLYGQAPSIQQQQQQQLQQQQQHHQQQQQLIQQQQQQQQQQLQQQIIGFPGGVYVNQPPGMFGVPQPMMPLLGYSAMVATGNAVSPAAAQQQQQQQQLAGSGGIVHANHMVNALGTNPFLAGPTGLAGGGNAGFNLGAIAGGSGGTASSWYGLSNVQPQHPHQIPFGHFQQQMGLLSLATPDPLSVGGVAGGTVNLTATNPAVATHMPWFGQQQQYQQPGQTLSTNLWQ